MAAGTPRLIPGLVLDLPKETPAEKRKRKRLAAKAAKAAKPIGAAEVPTSTEGAKVVLTISGPPKNLGAIPKKKSSTAGRQKTPKVGQGPNREEKGPGGPKSPRVKTSKTSIVYLYSVHRLVVSRGECRSR